MANHPQDILWVYNPTTKPFEVEWGGVPYRLESGEKKLLLRFIAEHFAKHLADAILMRREIEQEKITGRLIPLVNHPKYRPRIISIILPEVQTYFVEPRKNDASAIARMVEQVNRGVDPATAPSSDVQQEEAIDFGLLPDIATGVLKEPADISAQLDDIADEPTGDNDGTMLGDPLGDDPNTGKPKRGRTELLKEAIQLGIEVPPKATRDEIEALIKKQFA